MFVFIMSLITLHRMLTQRNINISECPTICTVHCTVIKVQYIVFQKKTCLVWFAPPPRRMHVSPNAVMPQKFLPWVHRPYMFYFLRYYLVHSFNFLRSVWEKSDISCCTLIEWYCSTELHLPSSALNYIVMLCCKTKQHCYYINSNY